jgi:hypothetical protein
LKFNSENDIQFIKASSKYTLWGINSGFEPISEYFVSQLLQYLGVNCVKYNLLNHKRKDGKYDLITSCKCYTSEEVGAVSSSSLGLNSYKDVIDYCFKLSDSDFKTILVMLLVDCLTINTDRHFGNIEFLVDNKTQNVLSLAPIFDNNYALLPRFIIGMDTFNLNDYSTRSGMSFDELFNLISSYFNPRSILMKLKYFKFINKSNVKIDSSRIDFYNSLLQDMINYYLGG